MEQTDSGYPDDLVVAPESMDDRRLASAPAEGHSAEPSGHQQADISEDGVVADTGGRAVRRTPSTDGEG